MINKKLIPIIIVIFLILGCASAGGIIQPTWQRTVDHYDSGTAVYYNKSLSFKITFPKAEWIIFHEKDKIPESVFGNIKQI